jgi:hypothetical protein
LYDDVPVAVDDDRNASTLSAAAGITVVGSSWNAYNKVLKDCYFPQKSSGGKLTVFANKSDGITTSMLVAKNLVTPSMFLTKSLCKERRKCEMGGRHLHVPKVLIVRTKIEIFPRAKQLRIITNTFVNVCL